MPCGQDGGGAGVRRVSRRAGARARPRLGPAPVPQARGPVEPVPPGVHSSLPPRAREVGAGVIASLERRLPPVERRGRGPGPRPSSPDPPAGGRVVHGFAPPPPSFPASLRPAALPPRPRPARAAPGDVLPRLRARGGLPCATARGAFHRIAGQPVMPCGGSGRGAGGRRVSVPQARGPVEPVPPEVHSSLPPLSQGGRSGGDRFPRAPPPAGREERPGPRPSAFLTRSPPRGGASYMGLLLLPPPCPAPWQPAPPQAWPRPARAAPGDVLPRLRARGGTPFRHGLAPALPCAPWAADGGATRGGLPSATARDAFHRIAGQRPCSLRPCAWTPAAPGAWGTVESVTHLVAGWVAPL